MSSSSDRTKRLSSKTKYNELSTNIRFHNTVTPVKKDGSKYEMFGVTRYNNNSQVRNSINTFNSYAERLELKKGKQYTNTPINGINNLKYDMKAGNLMQIKYNNTIPLVATGKLDISGEKLMSPNGDNLIPYPSNTITYPGFIIDPNNEIFKKTGVGSTENQQQNWIRNLSTTEFNDSNQWNKLNKSQDLQNFTLTGGVNLWSEFNINVTVDPEVSAYVMNGIHRKGNLINEQNPTLYFDPYDTINFIMDASGNDTTNIHKLRINITNYRVDDSDKTVTNPQASNQGIAKGTITWTPNRKGRFFYNCHRDGKMYGIIIIGDGSEKYPDVEQIIQDELASNVNETAITSSSQVNVIVSNGNKYVFNGENSYNPATIYTLTQGSYTFTNIPEAHPMAILNNNISNITYNASSNANNPIIIKVSGGSMSSNNNGDYYTFTNSNDAVINIANGGFKFMRGKTYRFDDDGLTTTTTTTTYNGVTTTTTTITHPLKIITLANNNTLNTVGGSITVTIPEDASTTSGDLYYQCSNHPDDMSGNLSLLYKQVTNSTADGFYDFYYGNMDVTVTGDFGTVSVYCYHHGYMGGENLLKYIQ